MTQEMNVPRAAPPQRARVLVVDDEPDLRSALAESLSLDGHDVEDASNGAVALELALIHRPEVVVFDFAMPVTDGPSLVEQLRTYIRPMPILVAISAVPEAARWCIDAGVAFFIMKPFEDVTLRHVVEAALRCKRGDTAALGSGTRAATRPLCVFAVGDAASAKDLTALLPTSMKHARVVAIDSPSDAVHMLDQIVPDLILVDDRPASNSLRRIAFERSIPAICAPRRE